MGERRHGSRSSCCWRPWEEVMCIHGGRAPRREEPGVLVKICRGARRIWAPWRSREDTTRLEERGSGTLSAGLEMESSGIPGVRASSAAWMKGARPRGRRTWSVGGLLLWGGKHGRGRNTTGGGRRARCVREKLAARKCFCAKEQRSDA